MSEMTVRVLPRQGGKTTEMVRLAAEEFLYIVCTDRREALRVHREAMALGLDIPQPVTWDDFVNRRYYGKYKGIKGFVIDNLDLCVQSMTTVPVRAVTLTDTGSEFTCDRCGKPYLRICRTCDNDE